MHKRINLLVPADIPESIYDIRVGLINWIDPSEEFGAITFSMTVDAA